MKNATKEARRVQKPNNKAIPVATSPRKTSRAKTGAPGIQTFSIYQRLTATPFRAQFCKEFVTSSDGFASQAALSMPSKRKKTPRQMRTTFKASLDRAEALSSSRFDIISYLKSDSLWITALFPTVAFLRSLAQHR